MKRKIIEGFWDCPYCGTTKIRGGIRECPNCGKARDSNTVFDHDRQNISYVPEEKAVHISRKPDWLCEYCEQLNSDNDEFCVSCGAARTENNLNYFQNREKKKAEEEKKILKKLETKQQYDEDNSFDSVTTSITNSYDYLRINQKESSSTNFFSNYLHYILISILILLGIGGLIFLFIPKNQEMTINEMSWEHSIDIERYQTVEESDWDMPPGARLLYTQEEFYKNEPVFDHYETKTKMVPKTRVVGTEERVIGYNDLGNGYFEEITDTFDIYETYEEPEEYKEPVYRDVPIYKTKYYYEIDKWLYERSVKTSGIDTKPYWGDVILSSDEKISAKHESYYITGLDKKGKTKTISLSYEDWTSLKVGQTVKLKVSLGYGKIVE